MFKIKPVILCGGSGSRLWPLSRKSYPKQFIALNSDSEKSLLQQTQERIMDVKNITPPILVCSEEHRFIVGEQIREINVEPHSIILEPFGRNTAPAIAVAAFKALEEDKDPVLLVLAADHKISDNEKFKEKIDKASKLAYQGLIVTFGIIPSYPETGYGYIESEIPLENDFIEKNRIIKFIEKPNKELAKELLLDKRFSWNSGIFVFRASVIIQELNKFHPEIIKYARDSLSKKVIDLDFERLDAEIFGKCPSIPIDKAVMEKTDLGCVLPLNVKWSDIGSWKSLWDNEIKDHCGNVTKGNVIHKKSKNCYLRSEQRLLVGLGLENIIAIETSDAILIANKDSSEEIKVLVSELKDKGFPEIENHKKTFRPWGNYLSIAEDIGWQVKKIEVKPGSSLSLQMHHYRSEHWIIVKGTALVEIDNKKDLLSENQSTYIPLGSKHRLSNPGQMPLILIEVQSGSYLGEDDIYRFEDKYGR